MRRSAIAAIVVLTLPLSACDAWLFGTQEVTIKVTDVGGEGPLPGVLVAIHDLSDLVSERPTPENVETNDNGLATFSLRPVIKACGGGIIRCSENSEGFQENLFAFDLTAEGLAETLEINLTNGETTVGEMFRLTIVDVMPPVPDSPPEDFFP